MLSTTSRGSTVRFHHVFITFSARSRHVFSTFSAYFSRYHHVFSTFLTLSSRFHHVVITCSSRFQHISHVLSTFLACFLTFSSRSQHMSRMFSHVLITFSLSQRSPSARSFLHAAPRWAKPSVELSGERSATAWKGSGSAWQTCGTNVKHFLMRFPVHV